MTVLLVVDVQNDFCPGGSLEVKDGNAVVPIINQLRPGFNLVIFTQDWHPAEHQSFAANHAEKKVGDNIVLAGLPQTLWPVHCVQGSWGAQLHPGLNVQTLDKIIKKGTDPEIDSYSAFYDNGHRKSTGLADYLHSLAVREISVCGLTTDYCVKYTVLDALREDFKVNVLVSACRGVNLMRGDAEKALEEMREQGARLATIAGATE